MTHSDRQKTHVHVCVRLAQYHNNVGRCSILPDQNSTTITVSTMPDIIHYDADIHRIISTILSWITVYSSSFSFTVTKLLVIQVTHIKINLNSLKIRKGHGKRLCKKIAKHVIWTRRMLWIVVDGRSW